MTDDAPPQREPDKAVIERIARALVPIGTNPDATYYVGGHISHRTAHPIWTKYLDTAKRVAVAIAPAPKAEMSESDLERAVDFLWPRYYENEEDNTTTREDLIASDGSCAALAWLLTAIRREATSAGWDASHKSHLQQLWDRAIELTKVGVSRHGDGCSCNTRLPRRRQAPGHHPSSRQMRERSTR